jgi:hypothetical protein
MHIVIKCFTADYNALFTGHYTRVTMLRSDF